MTEKEFNKMKKSIWRSALLCTAVGVFAAGGCVGPEPGTTTQLPVDSGEFGGISSVDIITVAKQMTPSVLAVPEITDAEEKPVRIKIADMENTSRFFIDRNLFTKRLAIELNKYGRGKIRFLNNNEKATRTRVAVLKERQSAMIQRSLKQVAAEIAASPVLPKGKRVKVAVVPVLNTNLVNMNADSFTAMLRAEVFNASAGKIQFLMPGVTEGADYFLTGQFIPESMKTEGIINLAEYIKVVDARVKAGKSMYIINQMTGGSNHTVTTTRQGNTEITAVSPGSREIALYETHLKRILEDPAMRANPNVNKRLNVMLVDAREKTAVYEKNILLDRKVTDNSGAARFILSGKISGLHKRANGKAIDYLLISLSLVDVESNETVWEDAYEVKHGSVASVVYR